MGSKFSELDFFSSRISEMLSFHSWIIIQIHIMNDQL